MHGIEPNLLCMFLTEARWCFLNLKLKSAGIECCNSDFSVIFKSLTEQFYIYYKHFKILVLKNFYHYFVQKSIILSYFIIYQYFLCRENTVQSFLNLDTSVWYMSDKMWPNANATRSNHAKYLIFFIIALNNLITNKYRINLKSH